MKRYLAYVSTLAIILFTGVGVSFGQAALPGECYATQSGAGINLLKVDLATAVATVKGTTTDPLPGLAVNSKGNLFGTSRLDLTQLYRVNASDGTKTLVGAVETAGGSPFHYIQAIAFDASDQLWGSGEDDFGNTVLVQIDSTDGTVTNSVFASNEYAGLAFDPTDGTLFASGGGQFDADQILRLNTSTGVATALPSLTGFGGGTPDIAFDASGKLFGVKGGGQPAKPTVLIDINKVSGVGTEVDTVTVGSVDQTHLSGFTCYTGEDGGGDEPVTVFVDIRPQVCPNQLNSKANGVVNVAILGTADFDVADIDVSSLTLAGQSPVQYGYVDISRPPTDEGPCACTTDGADGHVDLQLKFKNQDILGPLGVLEDGDEFTLTLEGALNDETEIAGEDCIVIKVPGGKSGKADANAPVPASFALEQNYPNPFNPTTSIAFSLPAETFVDLAVYNTMGQRVSTLVSATLPAGRHTVQWSATDDLGRQLSSGLYIYRIAAGEFVQTQKMLLLE